jgi:hypothetical protein
MRRWLGVFAAVILESVSVLANASNDVSANDFGHKVSMRVRVYDMASVQPATWQAAQAGTEAIFEDAGIQLTWVRCPCEPESGSAEFSLRIVPRLFGSWKSSFEKHHLGFAAVDEKGGVLATIFYDRVESLAKGGNIARALGLAIAHELGHLLLGSKAHAERGIMRPFLTRKALRSQQQGHFAFDPVQAEQIRGRLAKVRSETAASSVR